MSIVGEKSIVFLDQLSVCIYIYIYCFEQVSKTASTAQRFWIIELKWVSMYQNDNFHGVRMILPLYVLTISFNKSVLCANEGIRFFFVQDNFTLICIGILLIIRCAPVSPSHQ